MSTVQLDAAEGTSPFSVRYYHRDKMRKHTAYYPDTPLSLNHNIMQGHRGRALRKQDVWHSRPHERAPGATGMKLARTTRATARRGTL